MLSYPDQPRIIRVIGFDPATVYTGVSIGEISGARDARHLTIIHAFTLRLDKLAKRHHPDPDRYQRLQALGNAVQELLLQWRPSYIATESPFMGDHPAAFQALSECCLVIRTACREMVNPPDYELIDPTTVKKTVGVQGKLNGDKEKVRVALEKRTSEDLTLDIKFDLIDEHASDATGVVYTLFRRLMGTAI